MPLHTDTLTRRIRFAPPQPVDKRIELSDGDLALFAAKDVGIFNVSIT